MDGNGKYDREDLVRIAQAVFGPALEIDRGQIDTKEGKTTGYYVDLLERDGALKMKRLTRLCTDKSCDVLTRKILAIAEVEHKNWQETDGKTTWTKWETMDSLTGRLRAARPMVAEKIREQLSKESKNDVS